jgi:hypothetical protein
VQEHNAVAATFTALLVTGIAISYLPQHYRIIAKKSSEGFSPWFLLLGSVSSASVMLNVCVPLLWSLRRSADIVIRVAKQWGTIKCCRVVVSCPWSFSCNVLMGDDAVRGRMC